MNKLSQRAAVGVFLAFAFAYFISTLLRAVMATLSPSLSSEFGLQARDLGLLASGYFIGFAITQLPMGAWLDRYGPKKVVLAFLTMAVAGCAAFAMSSGFLTLLGSRVLIGMGVSACLMAPLTGYRRWFDAGTQLRATSWMLMTGSLGMLASTLPMQWLLPLVGWRVPFWGLAVLVVLAMVLIASVAPKWTASALSPASGQPSGVGASREGVLSGYSSIWRHSYFRHVMVLGFINNGAMVAIQTLWAGPWLTQVAGASPLEAARGLFSINLAMLCTFWAWGWVMPWLTRRGVGVDQLVARGQPVGFALLLTIIVLGPEAGEWAFVLLALYCMSLTSASMAQASIGLRFEASVAGRAMSAYNLVLFLGVFVVQWGIGLVVDMFRFMGWSEVAAFRGAMGVLLVATIAGYVHFMLTRLDASSNAGPASQRALRG